MSNSDKEISELASVIDEALSMLRKVGANVNDHRQASSKIHAQILKLQSHANDRIAEENQRRMLHERLLWALIEELVRAKAVDGAAVAGRFLSSVQSLLSIFEKHSLAQASLIAEQLSHPGFPDELPQPRGLGPTLIVDNDP